ncbi:uncharacterized protein [Antedon mediterranea]|uniref:uncharacterized protein n=1 Tax=Antedon mediterranea TaxID=105859 RepID=UPI003AF9E6A7
MDNPKNRHILCYNQRSVKHATDAVCSAVGRAIEDSRELNDDQKERLTKRFIEIYENTQHENILIDGQVWGKVDENALEKTKKFDAINIKRRQEVEELIVTTDTQTVTTTKKRKTYPKAITVQIAKKLMSEHATLEEYQPTPEVNIDNEIKNSLIKSTDEINNEKLQESAHCIHSCTKTIPTLEAKCERVHQTLCSYYKIKDSKTNKIITKPSPGESSMATSITQLRSRVSDETPSPIKRKGNSSDKMNIKKIQNHPISYNLRRRSPKKLETETYHFY